VGTPLRLLAVNRKKFRGTGELDVLSERAKGRRRPVVSVLSTQMINRCEADEQKSENWFQRQTTVHMEMNEEQFSKKNVLICALILFSTVHHVCRQHNLTCRQTRATYRREKHRRKISPMVVERGRNAKCVQTARTSRNGTTIYRLSCLRRENRRRAVAAVFHCCLSADRRSN